jgi:hypothetical protein
MEQNLLNESTMLRFLLDLLPEEDRVRVEESFFQDDSSFEELSALEDDLIDDYVRGRLSVDTRKAFEEKLRSSLRWQQRVAFAQALDRQIGEQASRAKAASSGSTSFFRVLIDGFRGQGSSFKVVLAAVGLIVLGAVISLAWRVVLQQTTLQRAQTERQNLQTTVDDLKGQIAGLQRRDQDLSRQLDEERRKNEEFESKRPGSAALGMVASFVLRAGLVRGSDSVMHFNVPPAARTVRLQLELDPADNYPDYRAELRTAKGTAVATLDLLRTRVTGAGKTVTIEVPAQSLPVGEYEVGLLGRVEQGKFEQIAYYYFDIQ